MFGILKTLLFMGASHIAVKASMDKLNEETGGSVDTASKVLKSTVLDPIVKNVKETAQENLPDGEIKNLVTAAFTPAADKPTSDAPEEDNSSWQSDLADLVEKHWGKAGIAMAVGTALKGDGILQKLAFGVLAATAIYFVAKNIPGLKNSFNALSSDGEEAKPEAKTALTMEEATPEPA